MFFLKNSDYSYTSLWGFRINNNVHFYDFGQVIPKDSCFVLKSNYKFVLNEEIKYIALVFKDMMDNFYELEVEYILKTKENETEITIVSGYDIKKSNLTFSEKEAE